MFATVETTKTCKSCSAVKPLAEFYKHAGMADGHLSQCKACKRAASTARYAADPERGKQICRDSYVRHRDRYFARNARVETTKKLAQRALNNAIARGEVTRESCEICGDDPADAHHEDYNYPLSVVWLCRRCHRKWHLAACKATS